MAGRGLFLLVVQILECRRIHDQGIGNIFQDLCLRIESLVHLFPDPAKFLLPGLSELPLVIGGKGSGANARIHLGGHSALLVGPPRNFRYYLLFIAGPCAGRSAGGMPASGMPDEPAVAIRYSHRHIARMLQQK